MFTEQLPDLPGFVCLVGDINIHFDNPLQSLTKQTLTTLSLHNLVQVINKPTHMCSHIIDCVVVQPDNDIHKKVLLQTHLNQTIIALNPISTFQPSTLCRTVWNMDNIDRPSFIAELSRVSQFSSVENVNQYYDFLSTELDKHAPPSLQKL